MPTTFDAVLAEQGVVFTRGQAARCFGRRYVDAQIRAGDWVLLYRGVYTTKEKWAATDAAHRCMLAGLARCVTTSGDTVVSHESAAGVLSIPLLRRMTGPPRITVHTPGSTTAGGIGGRYLAPVPREHRIFVRGVPITSAPRTVADLCRTDDMRSATVVADAALRLGVSRDHVLEVLAFCRRWPYAAAARETMRWASRWSESPLESLALRWCRLQGLPLPEQQLTIRSDAGRFLARVDFVWPELRTVAEVDGQVKYLDDADDPEQAKRADRVHWKEKLREDGLRDHGIEVARGYWSDVPDDGARFAQRVRRAFARAASYTGTPTYRIVDGRDHARRGRLAA